MNLGVAAGAVKPSVSWAGVFADPQNVPEDPWGNLTTGASTPGYAYTGREWDPEIGLYYYRARYYDPKIGRFIGEDPIGLRGGINLFGYVGNAPLRFIDPFGLESYVTLGGNVNVSVGPVSVEVGGFVAVDSQGEASVYGYGGAGGAIGLSDFGLVTVTAGPEVGVLSQDTPTDVTGLGVQGGGAVAVGPAGAQGTVTWSPGTGAVGVAGGPAVGFGAGGTGLVTWTERFGGFRVPDWLRKIFCSK